VRSRAGEGQGSRVDIPRTLYDKIWEDHLVDQQPDGTCLIYIDRHLVHEVTSPQAFEGLRLSGRKVRAPDKTLCVVDHNVPTTDRKLPNPDPESAAQIAYLAENAKLYRRERYEDAVRELRQVKGTTVLLFDQECAAEKRRARKRGRLPEPAKHAFINEDVCEGCGDCGDVSNCMSVQPVDTEFGRKTRIHQSSCNKDYSCTRGDCPSFLTVYTSKGLRKPRPPVLEAAGVPEPEHKVGIPAAGYRVYMPGIGGTGVVTANQVLAYAAMLEGREVHSLDQTGLAQKGGGVLSSLVILAGEPRPYLSNKVGVAGADLVLARWTPWAQ